MLGLYDNIDKCILVSYSKYYFLKSNKNNAFHSFELNMDKKEIVNFNNFQNKIA